MRVRQARSGKLSHIIPPRLRQSTATLKGCTAQSSLSGLLFQTLVLSPALTQIDRSVITEHALTFDDDDKT